MEPEIWDSVIFLILCYLHCVFISPGGSLNCSTWLWNLQLLSSVCLARKASNTADFLHYSISSWFLSDSEETFYFTLILSSHRKSESPIPFDNFPCFPTLLIFLVFPTFVLAYKCRISKSESKILGFCWVFHMQVNGRNSFCTLENGWKRINLISAKCIWKAILCILLGVLP